jgi:hypothetical protein
VRGTNDFNTQAIEVSARSSCLNSNDVFVLSTENSCFLWYGKVSAPPFIFYSEFNVHELCLLIYINYNVDIEVGPRETRRTFLMSPG